MPFLPGNKILASDYNALIDDVNLVYSTGTGDSGYGQTALPQIDPFPFDPSADKVIADSAGKDNDLADLTNTLELIGQHQGVAPTLPTIGQPGDDIETGDKIQAFSELPVAVSLITTNRLLVDGVNTTLTSPVLTSVRSTSWSTIIKHTFQADFGSDDAARFFFNTGGEIRLSMNAPDTVASHNWGGLYNAGGTFIFNHAEYYGLSATINNFTTFSTVSAGAGIYSSGFGNQWIIRARYTAGTSSNGARGSIVEIESVTDDVYAGNPAFPGSPDIVTGTFTSTISERRSTGVFSQASPTYTTNVELSA